MKGNSSGAGVSYDVIRKLRGLTDGKDTQEARAPVVGAL
jgi:hypothetical protein